MKAFINNQPGAGKIFLLTFLILSFIFSANAQAGGQPATKSQADLISDFEVNG